MFSLCQQICGLFPAFATLVSLLTIDFRRLSKSLPSARRAIISCISCAVLCSRWHPRLPRHLFIVFLKAVTSTTAMPYCTALQTTSFNDCSQCRTPWHCWSLVLDVLSTSRRSCAHCTGYPSVSKSRSSWQRLSTSAWTTRSRRIWLTSVDRLATIAPEWDQRRPGYSTCCMQDPHTETDHLLSQGQASGTACYTRSVTVQSRFQETAKDSSVWITIITITALVHLNWHLRNLLTYLLIYLLTYLLTTCTVRVGLFGHGSPSFSFVIY